MVNQIDNLRKEDIDFQNRALDGVSRTFALTIPQLPEGLRDVVGNAYLLCRIADTIEDEIKLTPAQKKMFSERFVDVTADREHPQAFAKDLAPLLSETTTAEEQNLILNTDKVIRITKACNPTQHRALLRCVSIMSKGMTEFQLNASLNGLDNIEQMDRYCYHVAGVVGEMLTELFCDHSPAISNNRDELFSLATSFGQALQMTNILKDIWEDSKRGACWLPRDIFLDVGFDLRDLASGQSNAYFVKGLNSLIAIAHKHQQNALRYIQLIPCQETGIRRHCLWALGMAVLTLRRIHRNPTFTSSQQVKISRNSVKAVIVGSNIAQRSNRILKIMFDKLSAGLPQTATN